MTITACDDAVCKIIEPNAAPTSERFAALKTLNEAGIPTVVWLTPILPFITDTKENIEVILNRCIEVFFIYCKRISINSRNVRGRKSV